MPKVNRIGDPISCGDRMAEGSPTVFANNIPVSRQGIDKTVGHCYLPTIIPKGSPNVFADNIPMTDVGDAIRPHLCPPIPAVHGGRVADGSPNVFINGGPGSPLTIDLSQLAPEEIIVFQTVDAERPAGVGQVEFAEGMSEDGNEDPIYSKYKQIVYNQTAVPPPDTVTETDNDLPDAPPPPLPPSCEEFDGQTNFPGTTQLSDNWTLAEVTTNTLVSNYAVRDQVGLTKAEIVCNLRAVAINILEPLTATYGKSNVVVNSGFRHGNGRSQHYKGQAIDVSFPNLVTSTDHFDRAKALRDDINYDQFIYEANNSIWYHLSYNPNGQNRRMVGTKLRSEGLPRFPGLRKIA